MLPEQMRLGCKGTKCKKTETKKQVKEQQNLYLVECHEQKIKLLQFVIHDPVIRSGLVH